MLLAAKYWYHIKSYAAVLLDRLGIVNNNFRMGHWAGIKQLVGWLQAIKPPTGVAYIAAKTYYFGVGGGTTSFKKMLKRDGMLEVHTVATFDEGDGNKREILKLKFPDHIIPYFL